VKIDHDLDLIAHRLAQALHHGGDMVDLFRRRRVGDEHHFQRTIAARHDLARSTTALGPCS
jgi:hypothetical protein